VALIPHYTQSGGTPAITGAGSGEFRCDCGGSLLIAGYEPRDFLDIWIRCSACGEVVATPGVAQGAAPPRAVVLVERGAEGAPATVAAGVALISREEMQRLESLYQPRSTDSDPHVLSEALVDAVEAEYTQRTGERLTTAPVGYKDHALAWAIAHFRARLRDKEWTSFADDPDLVAMTVLAAFRDLFASWAHHPLFDAMFGTVSAQGFSLHAMAMFGTAKSLASAGNRVGFVATEAASPKIVSLQLVLGAADQLSVVVSRFDRFEWPNGYQVDPGAVRTAVLEAMTSMQGRINRLRPGILVLSSGASEGAFDTILVETITGDRVAWQTPSRAGGAGGDIPEGPADREAARSSVRLHILPGAKSQPHRRRFGPHRPTGGSDGFSLTRRKKQKRGANQ